MKKLPILGLAALACASSFVGCNSSTDYTPAENVSSSVVVSSFKLSKDDSVLVNLDTVFFSIDLTKGLIYNAEPLPYGTRTDKLVPVISLLDGVSRAELTVSRKNGTDTVYNYITNSTDTIDFSNGPVKLLLVSPDGLVSKSYSISVNVFDVKSDSLVWAENARRTLPTTLESVRAQRTVRTASHIYCLTASAVETCMASAVNPADEWTTQTVTLPDGADVNTLAASDDALYILADGKLHCSSDGGSSWTDTGCRWSHIYGGYGSSVLGVTSGGSSYNVESYPAGISMPLPQGMPVSGTSVPFAFKFAMGTTPQILFVGGVKADGTLSADTWAFDGSAWAKISNKALGKKLRGVSVVPFYSYIVSNVFVVTRYSLLMAYGGNDGTSNSRTVYVSNDYGVTWNEAPELMQLPAQVPSFANAQAYVFESTLYARSGCSPWEPFDGGYRIPAAASRATEPITQWECPYIYTFGGTLDNGSLNNAVWRATINRMTFKPIQ